MSYRLFNQFIHLHIIIYIHKYIFHFNYQHFPIYRLIFFKYTL